MTADAFRSEFGFHGWTGKHFLVALGLIAVLAVVFIAHFGTNPTVIVQRIKAELGVGESLTVQRTGSLQALTFTDASGATVQVHMIGVGQSAPCVAGRLRSYLRSTLPSGSDAELHFDSTIPEQGAGGAYQAYLADGRGGEINEELLRWGFAKLDGWDASKADKGATLRAAQAQAQTAHRGLWACR